MLNTAIDYKKRYRVVVYLRMSSDKQNPRSPDQQLDEIKRRLRTLGYRWQILEVYRDDGISGRYVSKRPQFQKMLSDIKSGKVGADLILVDTLERFGRFEEISDLRRNLFKRFGVLVLTADSDFADPNSRQGRD
jgi:DNA invertase Pin-like site-specific DNA recombinase